MLVALLWRLLRLLLFLLQVAVAVAVGVVAVLDGQLIVCVCVLWTLRFVHDHNRP